MVYVPGAQKEVGLTRREWLGGLLSIAAAGCTGARESRVEPSTAEPVRDVWTATGRIAADRLGFTLMHEHVLVDFIGADKVSPSRYDRKEVVNAVLPHLHQVRELGCATLVECTPAYLGRDPELLNRLSEASGLTILSNTGYYGAANDKHLPAHAFSESAEQLALRWIREFERGIDGTSIRPAFMKIGVDAAPLSDVDRKIVDAAARTHRETKLPIASHTGSGPAAMEELDLLERAGVPLFAFIWVHAQSERESAFHIRAARRGAWVEFDGVAPESVRRHVELVGRMKQEELLGHVLVSHDAGWYRVGEPNGGRFRSYDTIFTEFIPAMREAGFDDGDIRQLFVVNPRRALAGQPGTMSPTRARPPSSGPQDRPGARRDI